MPPRPPRSPQSCRLAAAALVAAAACATPKQSWNETTPPEVFVEVLPHAAELAVDGAPLGPGARTVPVPDAQHVYVFRAAARGFAPAERSGPGAKLAGARLGLVLRPDGFGAARRLDMDEPSGLTAAAALLERAGQHEAALQYAERAVELAPDAALPRRVLGDAYRATGKRRQAIQEYSAYLQYAPDAPDRAQIEGEVEHLRGDMTIPGVDR
jgi:tetratricopeptide (TPR) repeat protein